MQKCTHFVALTDRPLTEKSHTTLSDHDWSRCRVGELISPLPEDREGHISQVAHDLASDDLWVSGLFEALCLILKLCVEIEIGLITQICVKAPARFNDLGSFQN